LFIIFDVISGHDGPVTCLSWDSTGNRLVSGGTRGEIVIWDTVI